MVAALPLIGLGYALWERGSTVSPLVVAPTLILLALSWLVGHAGAMWLNATLDHDRGAVLLGRAVDVPRATGFAAYAALALSALLSLPLGRLPAFCAAACGVLAILYSHPRIALKGRPLGGPLVNGVGYGALSPIAGWASIGPLPTWRAGITLAIAIAFILSLYFAAQAFQGDEDRRRGYRTLIVTHGSSWTLRVTQMLLRASALALIGCAIVGIYPRLLVLSAPIWFWADAHLAAWRHTPATDSKAAAIFVKRLALGALVCVLAAYAHHIAYLVSNQPGGGCATALVPSALREICAR